MGLFLSKADVRKAVREIVQEELLPRLHTITAKLDQILMNTTELKAALDAATAKVTKIETEQTARFNTQSALIAEMTDEIERLRQGELPANVAESLTMLETKLEAFDATIPDPAPPAPENPA